MPRKIVSTFLAAGVVLLILMWFASDPPPTSSARAGSRMQDAPRSDVQESLQQSREVAPASDVEVDAPIVAPPASEPAQTPPAALSHQNPAGVLEVLVVLDDQPLAGASVRLLRGGVVRSDTDETIEEAAATLTDARGVAMFEGLDGDRHLIVEARNEPDVVATVRTVLHAGEPTWRIVMQLGRGGVEGRAFALDGAPQADVRVALEARSQNGGHSWSRAVRTGVDGSYRIAGVPRGKAIVFADDPVSGIERRVDVELADGEWKRVDFGAPRRALRWSGRVKLASGANVEGFAAFEVRELGRGEQIQVACTASGEFNVELPPGEYSASAWTGAGLTQLGRITLVDQDVVRDLALPGIQLSGRVSYSGTWHDAKQPASSVQVWLERVGGTKHSAPRNADDRFVSHGLEKGEYLLTTWPNPLLGAGEQGIRVQLDGSNDAVVVDVTITDP